MRITRAFLCGQVWAIRPESYQALVEEAASPEAPPLDARSDVIPGRRGAGDVAVIPLRGFLAPRGGSALDRYGVATLDGFVAQVQAAALDPSIGGIVLDVDSPGGLVAGTPEAARAIRALRAVKPIIAVANTVMASGAFWVASGASRIMATVSAVVGSIGIVAEHLDLSRALDTAGMKVTLVTYGKRKAEANPYEPLGDEARASIQARVDEAGALFESDVAKGRGVPVERVRTSFGEGGLFSASGAVSAGLVDELGTLEDAIRVAGTSAREWRSRARAEAEAAEAEIALRSFLTGGGGPVVR